MPPKQNKKTNKKIDVNAKKNIKKAPKTDEKIIEKDIKTDNSTTVLESKITIDNVINEKISKKNIVTPKRESKPKKGYFLINRLVDKNVILLDYTFTPRKYKTERDSNITTEYTFVKNCTEIDMIDIRNDCINVFKNHRIKEINSEFALLKNIKTNEIIINEIIEKIEAKNYIKNKNL